MREGERERSIWGEREGEREGERDIKKKKVRGRDRESEWIKGQR